MSKLHEQMTVVVAARNAEATLSRCLSSIIDHTQCPVLLIDDHSSDRTAEVARNMAGDRLQVVTPELKKGLGNARQTALEYVKTRYLMWVDADDAILPGRVDRMIEMLRVGYDGVWDAAELRDGESGGLIRLLPIPGFLRAEGRMVRCFERNYLPGPAWPGLRTDFAKSIGYDTELVSGDDLDFLLRAIVKGGRLVAIPEIGYRQYAYSMSLSRDLKQQLSCVKQVLSKHSLTAISGLYVDAGVSPRIAKLACVYVCIFREAYEMASTYLKELSMQMVSSPRLIRRAVEPNGAFPRSWEWYLHFLAGSICLAQGLPEQATKHFQFLISDSENKAPELSNNCGVAYRMLGREAEALKFFAKANTALPGYLDSSENLNKPDSRAITMLPLRHFESRNEYSGG